MNIQKNASLAAYTSFGVGGNAERLALVESTAQLIELLERESKLHPDQPVWLLGYGSNALISDQGLPGLTIVLRGGDTEINGLDIKADAGVWWDDVVVKAIDAGLWGIELMSEIPGSVGAATYINITAYGQAIGPLIEAVDVWDPETMAIRHISRQELAWDYKSSIFQRPENAHLIILRIWLRLQRSPQPVTYQKALDVAEELHLNLDSLTDRRTMIIEARRRAGSIWKPGSNEAKTVGSFFRNPVVSAELAERIVQFDETGKTAAEVKKMNAVHGGDTKRVSAAHVMLAAGFKRGQTWGPADLRKTSSSSGSFRGDSKVLFSDGEVSRNTSTAEKGASNASDGSEKSGILRESAVVKLNDQNLLKIEAAEHALAQEVYDVAMHIQKTCQEKLGVWLEPEARILGEFTENDTSNPDTE